MLTAESRPRTLSWRHAGALLFGDWGTSRLYVLGLAFYYSGHASLLYLALMSVIMAAVAWAYTIVCRAFPDGGGVYTAARPINHTLSVVGGTLLLCNFMVTVTLSAVDGFHYLGVHEDYVVPAVIGTIALLGAVNWLGARSAGRLAIIIAVVSVGASAIIGLLCVPYLREGLQNSVATVPGVSSAGERWEALVRIVLALSGVEAVANITGMMKQPVDRTAKRTIWPVLVEVIVLNLVFAVALNAIHSPVHATRSPDTVTVPATGQGAGGNGSGAGPTAAVMQPSDPAAPDYEHYEVHNGVDSDNVPAEVRQYRDTAVKGLATVTASRFFGDGVGRVFGMVAGVVFALLLLSAANTAIMAMVSVIYALARDRELPPSLAKLNYSGVPWQGLIIACILPSGLVLLTSDVKTLSELYAIGVVGAIAVNLLSCAYNRAIEVKRWERWGLWALGGLMAAIEITIVIAKPKATLFAGISLVVVLGARFLLRQFRHAPPVVHVPQEGWLAQLRQAPPKVPTGGPRIMVAVRGHENVHYAVERARKRGAVLFAIYVRVLRVLDVRPGQIPQIEDDPQAQAALGLAAMLCRQNNVPFFPIYITATDIAAEILDYTVTFGCDELIMGKSRRGFFSRTLEGDVVAQIARQLPDGVRLETRAGGTAPVVATERQPTAERKDDDTDDQPPPS
ncbi:MAG TPA: amino acid permease [Phycisphaerales bacterium]|nr:amino acid permease [Phycisphaerales bacterium]